MLRDYFLSLTLVLALLLAYTAMVFYHKRVTDRSAASVKPAAAASVPVTPSAAETTP